AQQAALEKDLDGIEIRATDLVRRIEPKTAGENADAREEALYFDVQEIVAPIECRAKRLLPLRPVARYAAKHVRALVEPREECLRGQQPHARGRELDGERQAVQSHTELGDRRSVLLRHGEARVGGPRALDKERDCVVLRQSVERRQRPWVRQRKRTN